MQTDVSVAVVDGDKQQFSVVVSTRTQAVTSCQSTAYTDTQTHRGDFI